MSEHDEQVNVFQWAAITQWKDIFEHSLFAIPNQGGSGWNGISRGIKMVREGLKSSTADIFLAFPAKILFHGLFIEMKDYKKYLTLDQKNFMREMRKRGYAAFCCQGHEAAQELLADYMLNPERLETLIRLEKEKLYYKR